VLSLDRLETNVRPRVFRHPGNSGMDWVGLFVCCALSVLLFGACCSCVCVFLVVLFVCFVLRVGALPNYTLGLAMCAHI
jgi:hypothetical protein